MTVRTPISRPKIYAVIRRVPRGRVTTYGEVAALAGYPGHARQVGYALHALPAGSALPWHRVINSAGRLSLPPEAGGAEQRLRLVAEGVMVQVGGRVNLTQFRWRPAQRRALR